MKLTVTVIVELILSTVLFVVGFCGYIATKNKLLHTTEKTKKRKKQKTVFLVLTLGAGWFLVGTLLKCFSGKSSKLAVEFDMFSERVTVCGISVSQTALLSLAITGVILIFSLIFRWIIFPRFDESHPKGFQNVIELSVEAMENFATSNLTDYAPVLAPYMYALALFMVCSAASELIGLRAPTSDITVTFAMGLLTFMLINYFGMKKKGIGGRLKSMMQPTPILLPMKILSDISIPVSLACRLFGNMLGGMIVMDLLKSVLGGYATGLPAVCGLYFNLFHPVIQTYIFILLSMTFINEAIE